MKPSFIHISKSSSIPARIKFSKVSNQKLLKYKSSVKPVGGLLNNTQPVKFKFFKCCKLTNWGFENIIIYVSPVVRGGGEYHAKRK